MVKGYLRPGGQSNGILLEETDHCLELVGELSNAKLPSDVLHQRQTVLY